MYINNFKTVFLPVLFAFMFGSFGISDAKNNQLVMPNAQYSASAKEPGYNTKGKGVYQKNTGDNRDDSSDVD